MSQMTQLLNRQTLMLSHTADEGGSNVIMKKLIFAPEGQDPVELDLTGTQTHLVCVATSV